MPRIFCSKWDFEPPPLTNCDHSLIFAKMNISFSKQKCYKRLIWNFNNVNESELHNSLLAMDLESQIDCEDINIVYKNRIDCFRGILESYIPQNIVTIRPRDKPWMNTTVRRGIHKRNRLLKIHCRVKSLVSWEKYRQQRNYTTALIRYNKQKYYEKSNSKLQNSSISNKNWWGIVKSLYGAKIQTSIPTLVEGVKFISNAKEKPNFLMNVFVPNVVLTIAVLLFQLVPSRRLLLYHSSKHRVKRLIFC